MEPHRLAIKAFSQPTSPMNFLRNQMVKRQLGVSLTKLAAVRFGTAFFDNEFGFWFGGHGFVFAQVES